MARRYIPLLILWLCTAALGCAMCAAPDDYTGPIPGEGMGFNQRAGSILGGEFYDPASFDYMVGEDAVYGPVAEPVPAPTVAPSMQPQPAPMPRPMPGPQSQGSSRRMMR